MQAAALIHRGGGDDAFFVRQRLEVLEFAGRDCHDLFYALCVHFFRRRKKACARDTSRRICALRASGDSNLRSSRTRRKILYADLLGSGLGEGIEQEGFDGELGIAWTRTSGGSRCW